MTYYRKNLLLLAWPSQHVFQLLLIHRKGQESNTHVVTFFYDLCCVIASLGSIGGVSTDQQLVDDMSVMNDNYENSS